LKVRAGGLTCRAGPPRSDPINRHHDCMSKQTHSFQAEVKQILHLVTHSLYSNKEIFLRELISNASDACDKLRFEALDNAALYEDAPNLEVRVLFDAAAKTLTIRDNGIGMSEDEAIEHLGTIAKSGTREFVAKLEGEQKKDANLIGQFVDRPRERYQARWLKADSTGGGPADVVALTPLEPAAGYREAAIWVGRADGVVRRVEIVEASGQRRVVALSGLRSNIAIAAGELRFTPPAGARVVDQ